MMGMAGMVVMAEQRLSADRALSEGEVQELAAVPPGCKLMTSWTCNQCPLRPQCPLVARGTNVQKVNSQTPSRTCLVRRQFGRDLCRDLEQWLVGRFPLVSVVSPYLLLSMCLLCLCLPLPLLVPPLGCGWG